MEKLVSKSKKKLCKVDIAKGSDPGDSSQAGPDGLPNIFLVLVRLLFNFIYFDSFGLPRILFKNPDVHERTKKNPSTH